MWTDHLISSQELTQYMTCTLHGAPLYFCWHFRTLLRISHYLPSIKTCRKICDWPRLSLGSTVQIYPNLLTDLCTLVWNLTEKKKCQPLGDALVGFPKESGWVKGETSHSGSDSYGRHTHSSASLSPKQGTSYCSLKTSVRVKCITWIGLPML